MIAALAVLLALAAPSEAPPPHVVAWVLTVKACSGAVCKRVLERPWSDSVSCELAMGRLAAGVGDTPSSWYGFDDTAKVEVRWSCDLKRSERLGA